MLSEFYNVALNRLRYSLVWEDAYALYAGLAIDPNDRVMVITSAGCNVLNTLLKSPREVIAVDLNPVQNELLRFKKHIIEHHEHAVLRALMGFDGPKPVAAAFREVATTLPLDRLTYWTAFFESHPAGMLTAGKLETYLTGFLATLDPATQQKLAQLIRFDDVGAQWDFFSSNLHTSPFREQFIYYFDEANLSKGRAPELFKYAQESGGQAFYTRLCQQIATVPVQANFFFRFLFFGPQHLPESSWPPCYQAQQYAALRLHLDRLTIVDGEAIDYLLSPAGSAVNKASLSNIFEYTSQAEFRRICQLLHSRSNPALRFIFWNLLQEQGTFLAEDGWGDVPETTNPKGQETACFYFLNQRVVARD